MMQRRIQVVAKETESELEREIEIERKNVKLFKSLRIKCTCSTWTIVIIVSCHLKTTLFIYLKCVRISLGDKHAQMILHSLYTHFTSFSSQSKCENECKIRAVTARAPAVTATATEMTIEVNVTSIATGHLKTFRIHFVDFFSILIFGFCHI